MMELKQDLQNEVLQKERFQIDVKSLRERHTHELQLLKERTELEKEREKVANGR